MIGGFFSFQLLMCLCGRTKWCPYPGCEYAVNFVGDIENYDVSSSAPMDFAGIVRRKLIVDCSTVEKWILKNSAESENMNWILANSKPCPKCKRPNEKNQGCMHMTCTPPCKFEFCWLCLGSWAEHGERTGGLYACNRYEAAKQEGAMEKLSDIQREPESQLKFITDAWQQIVECRRVLKWTYAYGYYLPEREQAKKQFFEYVQGEAESALERLHQCAEKELLHFLSAEGPSKEFVDFHTKLAGLTG
ncbi:hypothetical protein FF1_031888 [Malus domestica]